MTLPDPLPSKRDRLILALGDAVHQPARQYRVAGECLSLSEYIAALQEALRRPDLTHEYISRVDALLAAEPMP